MNDGLLRLQPAAKTFAVGDLQATEAEIQTAERVRVQELLRYFQPAKPSTEPGQVPRVSSDTGITALAQLAAFKFGCERSFISLVDQDYQYIIAEATRSLSLESADIRGSDNDALLTGATALDLIWGMCASTIKVFTATDGRHDILVPYLKADKDSFVIYDMSKLDAYKDRPYVAGWPFMRYYAEVPILSPNGLCIGSICVVDNKPRDGLQPASLNALKEIARTVMDHLDLVMSRVQRKRAQQMIKGLGLFAEARKGHLGPEETVRVMTVKASAKNGSVVTLESAGEKTKEMEGITSSLEASNYFDYQSPPLKTTPPPMPRSGQQELGEVESSSKDTDSSSGQASTTRSTHLSDVTSNRTGRNILHDIFTPSGDNDIDNNARELTPPTGLKNTLVQAVNLICDAVNLDGVVFYDQRHLGVNEILSDSGKLDDWDDGRQTTDHTGDPETQDIPTFAKVLAKSSNESYIQSSPQISEALLCSTIKRLPRGGILRFDSDEQFLGLTEFDSSNNGNSNETTPQPHILPESYNASITFVQNAKKLNQVFHTRSMVLFPLWAPDSGKLFAYAIGVTSQATRVFQREDFAYIASFSNLLTAELSRLDIMSANHAKSVFISSISHELRSPLHGILGSAELLKEATHDRMSNDILKTIESCGTTLLDTFDNLLTFAKINNFTIAQKQNQRRLSIYPSITERHGLPDNVKSLTSNFDLSSLVENVMDSSIAGHRFRTSPQTESSQGIVQDGYLRSFKHGVVTVICDIQIANWVISSQPGVWTRILMNLLGNSLKYTSAGYIHVRLELREKTNTTSRHKDSYVCLSIEDTGCGISEEFMDNHLYKPFYQENPLTPGTGLGLSIVRQLVDSINGSITAKSEVGEGTQISVTAKIVRPETEPIPPLLKPSLDLALHGLRVGFIGFDPLPSIEEPLTGVLSNLVRCRHALKSTLMSATRGLGLYPTTVASLAANDVDLLLTTEEYYLTLNKSSVSDRKLPLILLSSTLEPDDRKISSDGGPISFMSQPFGPNCIVKALNSCLVSRNSDGNTLPIDGPDKAEFLMSNRGAGNRAIEFGNSATVGKVVEDLNQNPSTIVSTPNHCANVLLVEDNAINLKLLVAFMRKLNCTFETAMDGQQAVNAYLAAQGAFDIIFMDIQMPNKDGMTASTEIRQFEQQKSLKSTLIVAITGLASLEAQQQAAKCGIDSMLTKPVKLKTLEAIIQGHILKLHTAS